MDAWSLALEARFEDETVRPDTLQRAFGRTSDTSEACRRELRRDFEALSGQCWVCMMRSQRFDTPIDGVNGLEGFNDALEGLRSASQLFLDTLERARRE